jgi:hypothetical protein
MAKKPFTLEDNFDKVSEKISETPHRVLNIIGANLVKDVRGTLPQYYKDRKKARLSRSLGYWARKQEKDLQIGFKMFYAPFVMSPNHEPLRKSVEKNKDMIVSLIAQALNEIGGKR